MTGWKDVLTLLATRGGMTPVDAGVALGAKTDHVRVLLERCRVMGTVRFEDASARPRVYVLTDYGRRRVKAKFKRIGEWEVR